MSQVATDTIYSDSRSEQLSELVVRAVADAEGVDPTALDTPLYEAIDPDALDDLFSGRRTERGSSAVQVHFTYCGYRIHVYGDGTVALDQE